MNDISRLRILKWKIKIGQEKFNTTINEVIEEIEEMYKEKYNEEGEIEYQLYLQENEQ